jgi:multidrug resistance efflux pump
VVLDPERARDDLEPWARAGGGLVRDALDEADVNLGGKNASASPAAAAALSFDEKLRRLDQLRKDGLLTEEEYQQKREEVLKQQW